ncbi:MAG: threonine/serine dehydratase [Planctomycetota bacterium]|nr:threonine/serine dehydratase [Planctomycetota bacterium]
MKSELDLQTIREAHERIREFVVRTPCFEVSPREGLDIVAKAESLQPTGAFKLRGAFSLMTTLPEGRGVVAHSSGNHAQAVARAARVLGREAVVVMPKDAPPLKRRRTEDDGAEVVEVGPASDERAARAAELAAERGLLEVPPYDHPLIAAGQGTAAVELIEDQGPIDRFYAPVSGGGLMAGCATALSELCPETEIVAVEPEDGDDTKQSFERGERVTVPPPATIADGLRVRTPGAFTFPILQRLVSRVETVSDEEMLDAMAFALERFSLALEPSGAASLALALREGQGRCGVLLSGGNVEPELLKQVSQRRPKN